ncbi:MAG: indole-3-glycerol phosphate synthase TrpC [Prevotellaceae bacterium]|jgi:indole-3-glycerol phosphate synthase|nr:indole-3-glycerol phosphate synthase TrpC [Prevotellaceae bacterium]
MNILETILAAKREELAANQRQRTFEDVYREAREVARPALSLAESLRRSATPIIAEFKRRSPSKGFISRDADAPTVAHGYAAHGAAAISVLTDREHFAGSLADLAAVRRAVGVPLLRKDFVISPYQLCEARIAGADAALLIAAALTKAQCSELAAFARSLSLEVLLEVHDEAELEYACPHVSAVGVNNRNLSTFVTDTATSLRLAPLIPNGYVKVSESGISDAATVKALQKAGYQGFLMGEAFMKTENPAQALAKFVEEILNFEPSERVHEHLEKNKSE